MTKMATLRAQVYGTVLVDGTVFYQKIFNQISLKVVDSAV